ncbi:23272_t:CDS:2, partial [Gigaspora margarita]
GRFEENHFDMNKSHNHDENERGIKLQYFVMRMTEYQNRKNYDISHAGIENDIIEVLKLQRGVPKI